MPFDYTGSFSGSFYGDIASTNGVLSSSAQVISSLPDGVVSASTQINYIDLQNKPVTISAFQKNSIVANTNFRQSTFPPISESFDSRITILTSDVSTLSGQIQAAVSGTVPPGTISGSVQITEFGYLTSASAAAAGFGSGGGSSTDISALNTFTASIQSEVNTLTDATSSYLTSLPSGTISSSAQIAGLGYLTSETDSQTLTYVGNTLTISNGNSVTIPTGSNLPAGVISGSSQITITESQISDLTHTIIPAGTISSSAQIQLVITDAYISASAVRSGFGGGGGGGSFGDPPTIDQDGLTIREFTGSAVVVGTLTVTDVTPGDSATWVTQSGYTDGFFGISTSGVVTTLLNPTASWNTSAGSGSNNTHPFLVKVTDGQNNIVQGTVYIYVTPNSAPVFRIDGISGNIITNFTASLDESSSAETKSQYRIYVTDVNSDVLTIRTGSLGTTHFSLTIGSTGASKYVDIVQVTSSLDYETQEDYNFVLTASDANYEDGYSTTAITYLPYKIQVVDNLGPGIQNQTLPAISEQTAYGATVGSISATDLSTPGNTISYTNFTIVEANLDGGSNITGSLTGTNLFDPSVNPFTMNISGVVTRANSKFLNSDIANNYIYSVNVADAYNEASASALITIPIADATPQSIGNDGGTYYIQEGADTGDDLTTNSNGYSSGVVSWTAANNRIQKWKVNTVPSGYVRFTNGLTERTASSVTLEVDTAISGNLHFADGDTVQIQITASENNFESTKQYRTHTLIITENKPYSVGFSNTSVNLNTNGARPSNTLTTISFTEQQAGIGDTLNHNSFTFTDPSGQLTASRSSDTYLVSALTNLSGSINYNFTASITDSYGKIGSGSHLITIAQAGTGTLSTNGTFYVIESATSGDNIVLGTNGRTGTQGDLGVSYSPQYNSAAVASFTSSHSLISVASNGNLSVGTDISGSFYTDGGVVSSSITWIDQFGNAGGPTQISVNIAINNAPSVLLDTPQTNNLNTNIAVNNAYLARLRWSDTESDNLNISSFTLSGTGASSLSSSYNGDADFGIYANGDQSAGIISYTASIKDVHGFRVGTYKDAITIAQAGGGTITSENFYIIESALSGASITNDSDGIGSQADVNVTYSPNYGSPAAEQFRTLHSTIAIDTTGNLSVKQDISGSFAGGSSISPTIYWLDNYGNEGTGSITIQIVNNNAATAGFVNESITAPISQGTKLSTITIADIEGDSPYSVTLNGVGAVSMSLVPQNAASSSWFINAVDSSITDGVTLYYTASITDSYGETTTQYNQSIVVQPPASIPPLWYLYTSEPGQYAADNEATYLTIYGDTNDDGTTDAGYPFDDLTAGKIGLSSFTSSYYTAYGTDANILVASGSTFTASTSSPLVSNLNHDGLGFVVVFPSSSEIGITPSTMTNALGGSTTNQYVLYSDRPGAGAINDNPQTSYVRYFDLDSGTYPNSSATRFGVIFVGPGSANITYFLMSSSGSAPTSTQ